MIHPFLVLDNEGDRPASHTKPCKHLFSLPTCQRKWKAVNYFR